MTFKEKLQKEHPEKVHKRYCGGCSGCPRDYGYEKTFEGGCPGPKRFYGSYPECEHCWNREIPVTEPIDFTHHYQFKMVLPVPKEEPDVDIAATRRLGNIMSAAYKAGLNSIYGAPKVYIPDIKQVIFNDPATIVIWADGEKTVVKCQNGEPYDPEKGLTMAITKRALGNKGNYFDEIKKWTKEYKAKKAPVAGISVEEAVEGFKKLSKAAKIRRKNDV